MTVRVVVAARVGSTILRRRKLHKNSKPKQAHDKSIKPVAGSTPFPPQAVFVEVVVQLFLIIEKFMRFIMPSMK